MINEVILRNIKKEAENIVSLQFEALDDRILPEWQPGAHVELLLPNNIVRQYSLSGDPSDRYRWRITVQRQANSRGGSVLVHDQLRTGDKLYLRGPKNTFKLVESDRYLFIAGGIGITPILPMIRTVNAKASPWKLYYCGRSRSTMAFVQELTGYGEKVECFASDEDEHLDVQHVLAHPDRSTSIYCCGPMRLLTSVEQQCMSWPRTSLHIERFAIQPVTKRVDTAFEVFCSISDVRVRVAPEQSILEAVEAAGVFPPYSCREGTCGSCETQIVEGVAEHRDSVLSAKERVANESMMICVSRSKTARLVLEL